MNQTGVNMMNIAVLFGGKSSEHEVSLVSATAVMAALDRRKYRVFAMGIRKDGSFASPAESRRLLRRELEGVETAAVEITAAEKGRLLDIRGCTPEGETVAFDLFFPMLHGPYGEDGTVQGLLEMTGVPYVGCGVMTSALAMDKALAKMVFRAAGLPVLNWLAINRDEWEADGPVWLGRLMKEVGFPCFVKPARMGSSVGISKVMSKADVEAAVQTAFRYDTKVLVEVGIPAREIEVAVMGHHHPVASPPGEVIPRREFYDYVAKYVSDDSQLVFPADLEKDVVATVRELAVQAFAVLGGEGYARVDFFLDKRDDQIYLNEVNTIPGFTEISMFPKLWGLTDLNVPHLLDRLIELALRRRDNRAELETSYEVES